MCKHCITRAQTQTYIVAIAPFNLYIFGLSLSLEFTHPFRLLIATQIACWMAMKLFKVLKDALQTQTHPVGCITFLLLLLYFILFHFISEHTFTQIMFNVDLKRNNWVCVYISTILAEAVSILHADNYRKFKTNSLIVFKFDAHRAYTELCGWLWVQF